MFLFQRTGHEDGNRTDELPDEDTGTEVDIDEEEKQWAYALA